MVQTVTGHEFRVRRAKGPFTNFVSDPVKRSTLLFIMRPFVVVTTYHCACPNDFQCCAERRLLRQLNREASRRGIHSSCLSRWIHRKYGDFIVQRILYNGEYGTSLPCVLCRKTLERWAIQWRAHIGPVWVRSTDHWIPRSVPTARQKRTLGFK